MKCPECGARMGLVISAKEGTKFRCRFCGEEKPPEAVIKDTSVKFDKAKLSVMDDVSPCDFDVSRFIADAVKEANKRSIDANMVAINDRLFYSKLNIFPLDVPMICGLRVVQTESLPDDMLFSVFHLDKPPLTLYEQNEKLKEENRRLREKLNRIKELAEGGRWDE